MCPYAQGMQQETTLSLWFILLEIIYGQYLVFPLNLELLNIVKVLSLQCYMG